MMKPFAALSLALLLFTGDPGAAIAQESGEAPSSAAELRDIDAEMVREHAPGVELPPVRAYAEMIERTQAKCTWGWEIEVEDLVRWAHETLEAEGIHEFTFTFLKGIDDNFKDEDTAEENRFSCQDLVEEVVNRAIDGGESGDASDGEQRDQTVQVTDASPIEAHLLAHDANSSIVHGPFVRDYGELLDRAAAKCPEGRETVGKLAIAGHRALEDGDVRMLTREILQEIDGNFGAGELRERGLTCEGLISLVVQDMLGES